MKVYVVTQGEYSDYTVCGVYSTKEKAEHAKEHFLGDTIDEWELDDLPAHPPGMFRWYVDMDKEGNTRAAHRIEISDAGYLQESRDWRPSYNQSSVWFYVWAKDEQHAVKIANEKRAGLIMSSAWSTDLELFYAQERKAWESRQNNNG